MSEDARVQVRVDLPNHPLTESETLWARPLEDGRFEVRNVPFYAYGLNFLDLVRREKTAKAPGGSPGSPSRPGTAPSACS